MPIAFIATAPLDLIAIRAMPESILIMFSRSGDASELIAGSSRVIVWSRAFDFMSQNWVTAIFGAGQFGQLSTGIFGGEIARKIPVLSRSEEHTSELQSLMRISYAVFCLKKKTKNNTTKQKNVYTKTYI